MNKSFTIIIPLYNGEEYIHRTLLSIVNSDYDKKLIQVLVVDDGSSDKSSKIVKDFAKKYKCIQYVKKTNGQ